MNAQELRIGNYVYYVNPNGDRVEFQVLGLNTDASDIDPIPLTEEWLLNFGFDSHNIHSLNKFMSIELGMDGDFFNAFIRQENNDDTVDCILLEELKHVHQLQNLYHALTGKELTIKA